MEETIATLQQVTNKPKGWIVREVIDKLTSKEKMSLLLLGKTKEGIEASVASVLKKIFKVDIIKDICLVKNKIFQTLKVQTKKRGSEALSPPTEASSPPKRSKEETSSSAVPSCSYDGAEAQTQIKKTGVKRVSFSSYPEEEPECKRPKKQEIIRAVYGTYLKRKRFRHLL